MAFASLRALSVIPVTGGAAHVIFRERENFIAVAAGIAWTPDGDSIVYGTGPDRTLNNYMSFATQLWQFSIEKKVSQRLGPAIPAGFKHIAVNPDGTRIAFTQRAAPRPIPSGLWVWENILENLP